MFPLKKILCPVDFSLPSYEGLKVAVEMAPTSSAELLLINVIQAMHPVAAPGVPESYSLSARWPKELSAFRVARFSPFQARALIRKPSPVGPEFLHLDSWGAENPRPCAAGGGKRG